MQRTIVVSAVLGVSLLGLVGCGGQGDPGGDHPGMLSETIVTTNGDGTPSTVTKWLTPEQMDQLNAAKTASAANRSGAPTGGAFTLIQDTSCLAKSIWVYDQANGTGNIICFDNVGAAPQSGYARDLGAFGWDQRVRSYWPGDLGGSFFNNSTNQWTFWSAWGPLTNADSNAQGADTIIINGYTTCPSGGC